LNIDDLVRKSDSCEESTTKGNTDILNSSYRDTSSMKLVNGPFWRDADSADE
jgi:hypothetical protein